MANQKHVDQLEQGVESWNQWRREHLSVRPDLRPDLSRVNLMSVLDRGLKLKLGGDQLGGTDPRRADLKYTNLFSDNLLSDDLIRSDFHFSDFQFRSLRVSKGEVNLCLVNFSQTDLSSADLRDAILIAANLSHANLHSADLSYVVLNEAILSHANLSHANLSHANLDYTDLSHVNLSGANLSGANLSGANLSGANLSGANLSKVRLLDTTFARNDLSMVKGLVEIDYGGSSVVDLPTVKLPQDGSAFYFLRGVGVPNEWIDFYRAQMMSPIQYYSCFISYCSHDELLAKRLHADLQDRGVRCWFAPEDMKIGDKIRSRIDEAIHRQDKLLLLLSEHALTSTWVEDEVEAALEKEQQQQYEMLFPVRLDRKVMQTSQAWAAKLRRTRHIGDFTRWTDPLEYQQAFERLIRDLKAEP